MGRFRFEDSDRYLRVVCPMESQPRDHEEFNMYLKKWAPPPKPVVIFDGNQCPNVPTWLIRDLTQLQQRFKKAKSAIYLINFSNEGQRQIEQAGVNELLGLRNTLDELLIELGYKTSAAPPLSAPVDSFWNTALDRAIHQAFGSMLPIETQFGIIQNETQNDLFAADVHAQMHFYTPRIQGTLLIAFSQAILLRLRSIFIDEPCTELDAETVLASGELVDLVFQQLQAYCAEATAPSPQRKARSSVHKGTYERINEIRSSGIWTEIRIPEGSFRLVLRTHH